jgi:hypothetical protein
MQLSQKNQRKRRTNKAARRLRVRPSRFQAPTNKNQTLTPVARRRKDCCTHLIAEDYDARRCRKEKQKRTRLFPIHHNTTFFCVETFIFNKDM